MTYLKEILEINITELGFAIGHAQDIQAATGCTVILHPKGATAAVDVRGSAPATRETDLLDPMNMVEEIHGIVLSGGSAYGLAAADGVMHFLEEKNIGFDVGVGKVPIVCGACLFDLAIGNSQIRPDAKMGYQACQTAFQHQKLAKGNVGAGTGASVGKCLGPTYAMKAGFGHYAVQIGELKIGALVAVNAFGDVYSPENQILAGCYDRKQQQFLPTDDWFIQQVGHGAIGFNRQNTTIGCILTNAKINKAQAKKIASMSHDGYARAIRPVHTSVDGDSIFTFASGEVAGFSIDALGNIAAHVMQKAIYEAIYHTKSAYGLPSFQSNN